MAEIGLASAQEEMTVGHYLDSWLAHVKGRVRATTYRGYESLIRLYALPYIGEVTLSELHPLQVQRLYAELSEQKTRAGTLSAKTVGNLHRVLRQAFGQGVRWQLMATNPADAAQPPRARRPELAVIDKALAARILDRASGTRFELPVALAIATGMRRGEILGLRWSDLDPEWSVARISRSLQWTAEGIVFEDPKTPRSRRAVALPEFLRPFLGRQCERQAVCRSRAGAAWCEQGLVVDRGDGMPWAPSGFSAKWPTFLKKEGLPHVRFHDLRHAHATLMLLQGVHPKIVSERLGHSSIGITLDTYSHVLPGMQEEAARAFDELFQPTQ